MIGALAIDAAFAAPYADDAEARPGKGAPFPLRAIAFGAPVFGGGFNSETRRAALSIQVRVADWPSPAKGDQIALRGEDRVITDLEHADNLRLVWRLETEAADAA